MKLTIAEREKLSLELARARELAGVSQRRVAAEAGLSHVWVGFIENCGNGAWPSRHLLTVYARLCRMDTNSLLLAWCYVPDGVIERLRQNPELCEAILTA